MNSYSTLVNFHTSHPPPSPLSFTHSSSAYASRHFDCANEHNTPYPLQTHSTSYCMMRSSRCALSTVPPQHKERQASAKDKSACQTLALHLPLLTVRSWKVWRFWTCRIFLRNLQNWWDARMGEKAHHFESESLVTFEKLKVNIGASNCVWLMRKNNHKLLLQMRISNKDND